MANEGVESEPWPKEGTGVSCPKSGRHKASVSSWAAILLAMADSPGIAKIRVNPGIASNNQLKIEARP